MSHKDLKIVSRKDIKSIREHFGSILRFTEYLKDNPKTDKITVEEIFEKLKVLRDILNEL